MNTLRRHLPAVVLGWVLLLGMVTVWNTASDVGRPFGGLLAYRNHLWGFWQIEPATPSWWPVVARLGLRYDDQLIALEEKPYGRDSPRQIARAWQEHRPSVRLTVLRDGTPLQVDLPVTLITPAHFIDVKLPDLISGLGFWLLAIAVYRARPENPVNRVFSIMSAAMAAAVWLTTPGLFPETTAVTRLLHMCWIPASCTLGASLIHLTLVFPKPIAGVSRRTVTGLYVFSTLLWVPYGASMILLWRDPASPLARALSTFSNTVLNTHVSLGVGLHSLRLIWLWQRPDISRRLRRQVAVLLGGWVLFSPFLAIMMMRTLGTHGSFWHGLDLRCMVLAEAIAIAFVILRYQTFQPFHPMIVAVLILGTSGLIASLATWVMRLLEPEWSSALRYTPYLPLFVVVLLTSVAWSTQTSWRGALGRLFSWDRRSYDGVRQFGQDVVNRANLTEIPAAIVTTLVDKMELERAALWLREKEDGAFSLAAHAGAWPRPPVIAVSCTLTTDHRQPIRLHSEGGAHAETLAPLRDLDLEVVAPLWASGQPMGLLALGKRWDDEIFDERDLEIVELIAQQAALLLLTSAQVEELRRVPHQIAATQERERFKIAQELHDTVQQFLGRLPFYLEVSRDAARDDPAETETILERCMADVESAAQTVREIRANLAPLQLERSLTHPLRQLIEHFSTRTGLATDAELSDDVDTRLDIEARHALYRVVQQALDNVAAHAEASRVTITVTAADRGVRFAVIDDGQGFSEQQRVSAQDKGSFGLKSMQARVTSVGGELTADSRPGSGTQIRGWLPAGADRELFANG